MVIQSMLNLQTKQIYLTIVFNLFFAKDQSPTRCNPDNVRPAEINLSSIEFHYLEVQKILSGLHANKAYGPDNLSSRILKECANVLGPSLTLLFKKSFASGHIPTQWKQANVVPVHKKGNKSQVSNYRPISLLCIVSKVIERYIYNSVYNIVEPLINTHQHGFMTGKSCTKQLLSVYDTVSKHLDEGKQTDMIFLDFSKAFDSVNHNLLINKLQKLGFFGEL